MDSHNDGFGFRKATMTESCYSTFWVFTYKRHWLHREGMKVVFIFTFCLFNYYCIKQATEFDNAVGRMREAGLFSKLVSDFTPVSILESQRDVKNSREIEPLSPKSFFGALCFYGLGMAIAIISMIFEKTHDPQMIS